MTLETTAMIADRAAVAAAVAFALAAPPEVAFVVKFVTTKVVVVLTVRKAERSLRVDSAASAAAGVDTFATALIAVVSEVQLATLGEPAFEKPPPAHGVQPAALALPGLVTMP